MSPTLEPDVFSFTVAAVGVPVLRILHTSDWHLGASFHLASRAREHARFLSWLRGTLRAEAVDALVVAGDVFDSSLPSAEAQSAYYGFLAGVAADAQADGVHRQVVVVGGNHDSPARLDAPREVLQALRVHVVGGYEQAREAEVVWPLTGTSGQPEAVVVALPYVHEHRLGLNTWSDPIEVRRDLAGRFRSLYARLADRARAAWPGLPLLATGHLACGTHGELRGDAPRPTHLFDALGALPVDVFDPGFAYVALGHIHRSYRLGESAAWYAGTPVALRVEEAETPRRIWQVDLSSTGSTEVAEVRVPAARSILRVEGSMDEVRDRLRGLRWPTEELPPLLDVRLTSPVAIPDRWAAVQAAWEGRAEADRPELAEVRVVAPTPEPGAEAPRPALNQQTPLELFRRLYRYKRGGEVPAELEKAFLELEGENHP